jgi:hypothetical protein
VSDQGTRLTALLDDLENHRISVADACAQVRGMHWPRKAGKTAFQHRAAAALNEWDEPPHEDSIAPLAEEYHAGRIDHRAYEQLYGAYEEAQRDAGGAVPERP